MYIVFKGLDEWFKKDEGLNEKFEKKYEFLEDFANDFALKMQKMVKEKTGEEIEISLSGNRLKQAVVDALDDLVRLKMYHGTSAPNRLKEMSYYAYWFLKHKPMFIDEEDIIYNIKLNKIARTRLLFINEYFVSDLIMASIFPGSNPREDCKSFMEQGTKQIKYFKRYLLYYLAYRVDSPKSLEAIMLGTTIFPVQDIDETIWCAPEEPSEEDY